MISVLVEHPAAAYAYCGFRWDGVLQKRHAPGPFDGRALLDQRLLISTMSLMHSSRFLGWDEDPEAVPLADWHLWCKMYLAGWEGVRVTPEPMFIAWTKPGDVSVRHA